MQRLRKKYTLSAFTCTFPTMAIMTDKRAGSFQEAIADTWREKFSNVNVAMRNVNISA